MTQVLRGTVYVHPHDPDADGHYPTMLRFMKTYAVPDVYEFQQQVLREYPGDVAISFGPIGPPWTFNRG